MAAPNSPIPAMDPASPSAEAIHHLTVGVFLVSAVIFLLVAGLVTYALIRFRDRPGREASQREGHRGLEIAWTVGPLVILITLLGFTWSAMLRIEPRDTGDREPDLVVVAHQWWWEVRYPASGVITANELHIPVGEQLLVRVESGDVVHDFWVPQLARKIDAIPGHPNVLWLEADAPGTYEGTCSEYCGAQHANMRFQVVAEARPAFDAWIAAQGQTPPAPSTDQTRAGLRLLTQRTCASCHRVAGTSAQGDVGPDLSHVASRGTLAAGILENTPANLRLWLAHPDEVKPDSHMPNLHLGDSELEAVTAYLETLR